MPEAVFYRGPSGTIIDAGALEAELARQDLSLSLYRDNGARVLAKDWREALSPDDDPCRAEIRKEGQFVDDERFSAGERVEGTARLLRRVLPEPAKVISHMDPLQWSDFQGSKADSERIGPGPSIYVKLTPEQDARNAALAHEILTRPLRERTRQLAKDREDYCLKLLEQRLPRPPHWLIDYPRLLKRVLRVVKRWDPTLTYIPLQETKQGIALGGVSAHIVAKVWRADMEAEGEPIPDGGLVFTYTDASGLPAEVYGPVA
jgi:hypothetical protein